MGSSHYMQNNSTPLGKAVQNILAAQEEESPFPEGMDTNWALDVQSAQTLDFLSALKKQSMKDDDAVAWDLGTLTGVSAAVLSQHFDQVVTIEREAKLAEFAKKHLGENVTVVLSNTVGLPKNSQITQNKSPKKKTTLIKIKD